MRWKRRRLILRSLRRRRELKRFAVKTIPAGGVLVFSTMRNEMLRLEYWLSHYRNLGVSHFLVVDNDSDDGTRELLAAQPDVSVWTTPESYKASRFGVDWLTCLQFKFGDGRWCLSVDCDELLVFPGSDRSSLTALTLHLEVEGRQSMGAIMLDLYPKGSLDAVDYAPGSDPLDVIPYFDQGPYRARFHPVFDNLWIQGGVRDRMFFGSLPDRAPTLNKTPLVKWSRRYCYVTSTHQMLPRHINDVFDTGQGDRTTGALLHTKFLPNIAEKSREELSRQQHFENSDLYQEYYKRLIDAPDLWDADVSVRYEGPEMLEAFGLMSRGNWSG